MGLRDLYENICIMPLRYYKMSVLEYLEKIRMEKARLLLKNTDMLVYQKLWYLANGLSKKVSQDNVRIGFGQGCFLSSGTFLSCDKDRPSKNLSGQISASDRNSPTADTA